MVEKVLHTVLYLRRTEMDFKKKKKKLGCAMSRLFYRAISMAGAPHQPVFSSQAYGEERLSHPC